MSIPPNEAPQQPYGVPPQQPYGYPVPVQQPTGSNGFAIAGLILAFLFAPLGLVFDTGSGLPARYGGGAFVGEHGSWNRQVLNGYKVVFVPFANGKPNGLAEDVVTGFLDQDGHARGRPVGLALDKAGALMVADDVGNTVWRVTADPQKQAARTD